MIKQEQSKKIVYGSLITSTKCYNCIHFPLCFAQKGGANLELASENDCCYYQSKLPKDSVVLSKEEQEKILKATESRINKLKEQIKLERKETAEKILQPLYNACKEDTYGQVVVDFAILENLAKQFGVEIKE